MVPGYLSILIISLSISRYPVSCLIDKVDINICLYSVSIYVFIFIAAHAQVHNIISTLLTPSSASLGTRRQGSAAAILDEVSE